MDKRRKGVCVDCGKQTCRKTVARCKSCGQRTRSIPPAVVDERHRHVLESFPPSWTHGYASIFANGQRWYLHRYLWTLENGHCPEMLDHIDGDKLNCRMENLRPADKSLNARNYNRKRKYNLPRGIKPNHGPGKPVRYSASIRWRKRNCHLGTFATAAEASAAYENARSVVEGFEEILAAGIPPTTVLVP